MAGPTRVPSPHRNHFVTYRFPMEIPQIAEETVSEIMADLRDKFPQVFRRYTDTGNPVTDSQ